jgi:hypothetical protein
MYTHIFLFLYFFSISYTFLYFFIFFIIFLLFLLFLGLGPAGPARPLAEASGPDGLHQSARVK